MRSTEVSQPPASIGTGRVVEPRVLNGRSYSYMLVACAIIGMHAAVTCVMQGSPDALWHHVGLPIVDAWGHLDSVWYTRIAEDGYQYSSQGASAWAFFPGFPLAIRGVHQVTGLSYGVTGYTIDVIFGLLTVGQFYRLAVDLFDSAVARRATLIFLVYPYAVFIFGPVYSEPLTLFLILTAFRLVESDRFALAGFAAGGAAFCRPIVVALVLGLAMRAWERTHYSSRAGKLRSAGLVTLLACSGQLAASAYSFLQIGDPLAFLHAQTFAGWQGETSMGSKVLKVQYFQTLSTLLHGNSAAFTPALAQSANLAALLACLVTLLVIHRRVPRSYLLYSVGALIPIIVGTSTFSSAGRYVLPLFPVFLVLGTLKFPAQRLVWGTLLSISFIAQMLLAVGVSRGIFVS